MRKLLLMVCALFGFMACIQNPIEEQSAIRTDAPETIRVGFEDDETRIQLNSAQKTVWTKGDLVSVFYRSDANQKWQYQGETGERVGDLKRVDAGTATESTKRVVVVYPYNENYYINTETYNVQATLPATQHYLANSYGTDGNIMISSSEYNQFSLKSVCGWLKLQLTGDGEVVKSIKFRGNDDEQVAGELYVNSADATAMLASDMGDTDDNNAGGNLVFDDTILTEVVLDCGEGVTLGKSATAFYIALPPQTFANGFTVDIECEDYELMTLSTEKELVIERNHIQPMASVEHNAEQIIPNNEIWYTATAKVEPTFDDSLTFGVDVVSNVWDSETKRGIITFDGDVTMIGDDAFNNCDKFTGITLPESVTSIGKKAFYDCDGLTEFIIPDSVTEIGDSAFYFCSNLTSITIPDSVTMIGNSAFYSCSSLTSVTIPDSVTEIGRNAFYGCFSLQEFNGKFASEDGRCLIIDGELNSFAIGCGATEYTIPDSVTTIGSLAFYYCSSLTSATIPDSVTAIGNSAFGGCSSLTSVTIPDSVTSIGSWAFLGCSSLTSATIPDSVTTIGNYVFQGCSSLQEFNGKFASEDGRCLIIDGTLDSFAPVGLTEYTIPDSVITIRNEAFRGCTSLTSVTIGDSVTTIGYRAFEYCDSLTSVYCKAITPPVVTLDYYGYWRAFNENASGRKIYVPTESVEAYKSAEGWSEYADDIVGYDFENGVVVTPKPANNEIWYTNGSTTEATTPNNTNAYGANIVSNTYNAAKECWVIKFDSKVTTIGNEAFRGCSSLTSVTIPDSVTAIGYAAFEYCSSLTSVIIPDSVTTIVYGAFRYCYSLTSVTIPDSVTSIGDGAFSECSSLTSVTIPDSVTSIGGYAFSWCESLQEFNGKFASEDSRCLIIDGVLNSFAIGCGATEYTIPDSVTTIGDFAFHYCSSLTSITIPDSVTTIGYYAFYDCSSLTSVTIPDSVTTIGDGAFYNCRSLTSITIPDSVATIGDSAFSGCDSLTSITIPDSVTSIGMCAFAGCTSLTSVTIPDSVATIGGHTFENCSSLTSVYCKATTPPVGGSSMFYNNASDRKIYVPMESVEAYKSASGWSSYSNYIEGYNF